MWFRRFRSNWDVPPFITIHLAFKYIPFQWSSELKSKKNELSIGRFQLFKWQQIIFADLLWFFEDLKYFRNLKTFVGIRGVWEIQMLQHFFFLKAENDTMGIHSFIIHSSISWKSCSNKSINRVYGIIKMKYH